jgi:hypothetical protein
MRNAFDAQGRKRDWYCEDVFTGDIEIRRVFEDDLPSLLGPEALDPALLVAMINAVQEVARRLKIGAEGLKLTANAGATGVTPHMHWHVMSPL